MSYWLQKNKSKSLFLLGILVLLLPALFGIFHPGFLSTDDGNWMVIRLSAFYEALRQGQFPVRFLPRLNNGYGYPVSDFLYPLYLYVGSIIHVFHFNFVLTIKILFGLSLIASAVGAFLWLRNRFGEVAGFIGSLIFTLFPYHMWDITKRGSLGEALALGIVPFIFWQIDTGNLVGVGIALALLVLGHNTLALLFLPVILLYIVLEKKMRLAIFSLFLGLGISAFFWLPALYDKQFTVFDLTTVSSYTQYFLSANLYPLIGIISFVVILLSFIRIYREPQKIPSFFIIVTLLSLSLTSIFSKPIWELFQLGKYVQFSFRFLSMTALGVGFLSAYLVRTWKKEYTIFLAGLFVLLLFISSWNYFFPRTYQYYPDGFYSTNQDSTTVQNEYMPRSVKEIAPSGLTKVTLKSGGLVRNLVDRGSKITFQTISSASSQVTVTAIDYPGWVVRVDTKNVIHKPSTPYGFISFTVDQGQHNIMILFKETPLRLTADVISLLSILTAGGLFYLQKRRKV